jgi:endonuclease-3 related protein
MFRKKAQIAAWYGTLVAAWGPQHWWPAQSRFEVIVGAFLTQNTAWVNVEHAMRNLRRARALSLAAIRTAPLAQLEQWVRPSGYFRQKAQRLKSFVDFLDARYGGSLERMFAQRTEALRAELLALNGVGRETADSILLYAGGHAVFVVDAYTRRVAHRHRIAQYDDDYDAIRARFERELSAVPSSNGDGACFVSTHQLVVPHPPSRMSTARRGPLAQVYNEMHGLLVNVGKHHCHKHAPHCEGCPLAQFLPPQGPRTLSAAPRKRNSAAVLATKARAAAAPARRSIMK